MTRITIPLLLTTLAMLTALGLLTAPATLSAQPRVKNRDDVWRARCAAAHATWPPSAVTFVAYKQERTFEVWARTAGGRHVLLQRYPICNISGELGPKSEQGDLQVPEGVYTVVRLNPFSSYHLSLGIDYPNRWDRLRIVNNPPGGDIFIHGDCVSAGCIALGDSVITEVYWLAQRMRATRIPVLIFPVEADDAWARLLEPERPALASHQRFWSAFRDVHRAWTASRMLPRVSASRDGAYVLAD